MIAMLIAPVASFYACRALFIEHGLENHEATTMAAFGAVSGAARRAWPASYIAPVAAALGTPGSPR
jgi:hypothetical protein